MAIVAVNSPVPTNVGAGLHQLQPHDLEQLQAVLSAERLKLEADFQSKVGRLPQEAELPAEFRRRFSGAFAAAGRRIFVFEPRLNGQRRPELSQAIVLVTPDDLSRITEPVIFAPNASTLLVHEETDLDVLDGRLTAAGLQTARLAFFNGDPQAAVNEAIRNYLCYGLFPQ